MSSAPSSALENFLDRVRQCQRSRAKQLVLSIEEANDLSVVIAQLLLDKTNLLSQINDLQKSSEVVQVTLGGGSFAERK